MKRKSKLILGAVVLIGLVAGFSYWFFFQALDFDMEPITNKQVISFEELNEKIYVEARAWGLGGNHSEILLSNKPIKNRHREYFEDQQYSFINSSSLFYKKVGIDTLELYVSYPSQIPEELITKVKIVQNELKNAQEISDYEDNYQKYGLSRISIYDR